MKYDLYIVCCCILVAVGTSCSKHSEVPAPVPGSLVAKWSLVIDSTFPGFYDPSYKIYNGIAADSYDFRTDGMLYIREGSSLDTFVYKIYPDSTFSLAARGTVISSTMTSDPSNAIISVTSNSATIRIGTSMTDGPSDMIHLKK